MVEERVKILAVDDDASILLLMRETLKPEGYTVITAENGAAALQALKEHRPALVLLDIRLPDIDGYAVCKRIRKYFRAPIIMVTGKTGEEEEALSLEAGADDYITKPFTTLKLTSHVKAVLRRNQISEDQPPPATFRIHDLDIDFVSQTVTVNGEKVKLTATEYRMLAYLAWHADRVISSEEMKFNIWDEDEEQNFNTLRVNLSRLRQKLNNNAGGYEYIETRPGQGYFLSKPSLDK